MYCEIGSGEDFLFLFLFDEHARRLNKHTDCKLMRTCAKCFTFQSECSFETHCIAHGETAGLGTFTL